MDPNVQIELPFVSCFTEIPVEAIEFHAEHYGAFGLAFKKSRLLDEERFQIIRPVAYLDACESSVIPLLIAAIEDNWDHPGKRIRLLRDLFLTKPHNKLGFYPENAFSTYYEREWRYVSHLSWFRFEPTDIEFITVPSQSLTSLGYNALKEGGSVNQAAWTDGHPYKGHEKWVGYKVLEVAEQLKLKVMPIPILK
ncbi:MAG: abortive infection system antitoxin AbiGi family protein [Syntrophales bacterium]|nr:abortive infection system antitoxin AbiGi family protein [Syntrophales bacterium]